MPTFHRVILVGFLILGGFCARAATYAAPLLDHHAWRQADTAAIARNFYREHFNIAFPQVDHRGAQPHGYVETGLEVLAFLVAGISLVTGYHQETGRILSSLFFIGSAVLVWQFVRRRYDDDHGVVAVFFYAFGLPLLLYIERAFMNEALLIFLSFACLVATARYLANQHRGAFISLLVASSLIAAIKLPYLIIWGPILGLFVERYGMKAATRPELWILAAINGAVSVLWYSHASDLAATTGLSFGLAVKMFDPEIAFWPDFVSRISIRLFKDILGPVGTIAMVAGVVVSVRQRRWCELLGVAAFATYLMLVEGGNFHHSYYQLAIIPIVPSLVASGVMVIARRFGGASEPRRAYVLAGLLGVAALSTFVRLVSAHSWYEIPPESVELCRVIGEQTTASERVVFAGDNDPAVLFCADRKGWLLPEPDVQAVRSAVDAGARLVIVSRAHPDSAAAVEALALGQPMFVNARAIVFKPASDQ